MFVDSHCHLSDDRLLSQLDVVLQEMKLATVSSALCVSTTLDDLVKVQKIIEEHPHLWGSVGIHPSDLEGVIGVTTEQLIEKATHEKIVAIGETGLDYYWHKKEAPLGVKWQQERFHMHIEAARATGLPLIIHTRDSIDDTLSMLTEAINRSGEVKGVFHCFTENRECAKKALDLGFYLSFSGILTFKSALELKEVARFAPQDVCLIETDSPYLTPH
ncbi:MAG: TatD family hydrolase, partial [Shewanella sp.]